MKSQQWIYGPELPLTTERHSMVAIKQRVYVIGGYHQPNLNLHLNPTLSGTSMRLESCDFLKFYVDIVLF